MALDNFNFVEDILINVFLSSDVIEYAKEST
jgi:hypothetical protein